MNLDNTVELLRDFLRIDTTNPPGNEEKAALFIQDLLRREGFSSDIYQAVPGRANILSRIKGRLTGKPVILLGHIDVVPAKRDEWSHDPFGAEVKDGFIYGRGAIDMKAQVICQLAAFVELCPAGINPQKGHYLPGNVRRRGRREPRCRVHAR